MASPATHKQKSENLAVSALPENTQINEKLKIDQLENDAIPPAITITDNAANKVQELIDEEGNPHLKLRAYVTGGGCSGLQYGFTFDEEVKTDDTQITKNSMTLLVDPMSYLYLAGATIDYVEDLEGARFVIHNPNAKTTCGCGSSFNADPSINTETTSNTDTTS